MENASPRETILRHGGFLFLGLILLCPGCGSSRRNADVEAQAKPHSVTISWAPSQPARVAGYNVFRGTLPGPVIEKLNPKPLTGTQFQDTTVEAGRTYAYCVTSIDAHGHESGPSERVVAHVPESESLSFVTKLLHLFRSGS